MLSSSIIPRAAIGVLFASFVMIMIIIASSSSLAAAKALVHGDHHAAPSGVETYYVEGKYCICKEMPTAVPTTQPKRPCRATPSLHSTRKPSVTTTAIVPSAWFYTASPSTFQPTSSRPSITPSTIPTTSPSTAPTLQPTAVPTLPPTALPSLMPASIPTTLPLEVPSASPSANPSSTPSLSPSSIPTSLPTILPSLPPTAHPSTAPTHVPTATPSIAPSTSSSSAPSVSPSVAPSLLPSEVPTTFPSVKPSSIPSIVPSSSPSSPPSSNPTEAPTVQSSIVPTTRPTLKPSSCPSTNPTLSPSAVPSQRPSINPTASPSASPSVAPILAPSAKPSPPLSSSSSPQATPSAGPSSSRISQFPTVQGNSILLYAPQISPSPDNILGLVNLRTISYSFEFEIFPIAIVNAFAGIIQLSGTGLDCQAPPGHCELGDQAPGVYFGYFAPRNRGSTALRVYFTNGNGSNPTQSLINGPTLALNTWTLVSIQIFSNSMVLSVGSFVSIVSIVASPRSLLPSTVVFTSRVDSISTAVANCSIRNINITAF